MDDKVFNSYMALLNTLEQAEQSAWRQGYFTELIALAKTHLIAMHFYDDGENAIENLKILHTEPPKENEDESD